MFQVDRTIERQLFAFSYRDLVDEDSDVWLYCDLFNALDLLEFDSSYVSQGQAAKDPRLMLRTIFYALTHGVVTGRKLQDACCNDNRFIVLSGDTRPDRRTFDRFLKRHKMAIDMLFKQVVKLAQEMGLVSLGRVAIDGSKFRAYAGKHMRHDKMEGAIKHIEEELTKLREDLSEANKKESGVRDVNQLSGDLRKAERRRELIQAAKERIEKDNAESKVRDSRKKQRLPKTRKTLHDLDALTLGESASFPFGYNAQAAVDEKSQIVLAAELHDNASDQGALPTMLDKVKESCGSYPEKTLADCGYNSLSNLEEVAKRGSESIISLSREYAATPTQPCEQVIKGEGERDYFCLAQKKLTLKSRSSEGYLVFHKPGDFCNGCPFAASCTLREKNNFQIIDDAKRLLLVSHLQKCRSDEFSQHYRRRKVIVEPVFGNIKNKGIKIHVRGASSVGTWWKMACTAHNIEKILKRGWKEFQESLNSHRSSLKKAGTRLIERGFAIKSGLQNIRYIHFAY